MKNPEEDDTVFAAVCELVGEARAAVNGFIPELEELDVEQLANDLVAIGVHVHEARDRARRELEAPRPRPLPTSPAWFAKGGAA